jgi:PST family polysaccharide transporter
MINKVIRKISGNQENRRLLENIFSLGLLQGANFFLPLITIPYLVRILGPDYFGLLAFATATIMYLALITDYGFNLSATRQISIYRDNHKKVSEIFSSVMIIKTSLMLIGLVGIIILVTVVDKFHEHWEVYIVTFGIVIGQVLFPIWLFQGVEMMKYITYINIFSKIIFTILIFIFVDSKSDFLLVPLFTALGSILGGIWSLNLVINKMCYKFAWPRWTEIKFQLKDGWHVFFSSIAISIYTISATFILGLLTNNSAVGQFAAVDKIIQAGKGIYQPISQAIFPMIGKKFHQDKLLALMLIKRLTQITILTMSMLSGCIYLFSEFIIRIILGDQYLDAIILLKIMSPLPLIISISNILGIQVMLNLGLKSAFSLILSTAALGGVALSLLLVPILQEKGVAYTMVVVEIFVTIAMFFYVKNYINSKVIKQD